MFAYAEAWTGMPTSTFFILFVLVGVCLVWMHWTIHRMLAAESAHLDQEVEIPASTRAAAPVGATSVATPEEAHA